LHEPQAHAALAEPRPVLVEKPLALDAAGAVGLRDAARESSTLLAVGMNLRFHPGPDNVRSVVQRGDIGRPLIAHATFGSWLPSWRPTKDYRSTYSAKAVMGGGVVLDAIHEIDYLIWTLGPVREVGAWLGRVSDLEIDVEDTALIRLTHASGCVTNLTLDYLDRSYRRGCRVIGDEGTVSWAWETENVAIESGGERSVIPAAADVAPTYRSQLEAFLASVRGGRLEPPLGDPEAACHALAIVDAARLASVEDRTVTLPTGLETGAELTLRHATVDDEQLLLDWRNDETVRAASFSSHLVAPDEHHAWLARRLADSSSVLLIVEEDGHPLGQVRLDALDGNTSEISISVVAHARDRGVGHRTITLAEAYARRELATTEIVARVKRDNERSLKTFNVAGFREVDRDDEAVILRKLLG
jgi:predicted dehydrogenase/RimJ/RimL family protein N-acetyltransferase